MEKIAYLSTSRLRNDEHYQFMADFGSLSERIISKEPLLAPALTIFKTAFVEEDKAMKVELGSSRSAVISELDAERDKTWNAIYRRVEASVICPVAAEAKAAAALKRVLDLYGDKRDYPYNEETAALTNLLADLLSATNTPHLQTLGLVAWVNALRSQNEAFQSELNTRNQELAGKISSNAGAVRTKVDEAYKNIVDRINAAIVLGTATPGMTKFVSELNEKISYYLNTIDIRKGRRFAAKARLQA